MDEERNGSNGSGSFFLGLIFGGLVGAGVALLVAPQSGEETRSQIRSKSMDVRDTAEETADEAMARVQAVTTDLSARAKELQVQGRKAIEQSQKELAQAVEETRRIAGQSVAEIRKAAEQATRQARQTMDEAAKDVKQASRA